MQNFRGGGIGEAGEATASPEFSAFTQRNFKHLGYMKGEIFRASPEKSLF